jgi:hypothetical protein
MAGPLPKNPTVRARKNRVAGSSTLPAETGKKLKTPPLPKLGPDADGQEHVWHPLTRAWWREVWASPLVGEFIRVDLFGLYRLALLVDRYWREATPALACEIRLQGQCYGLTPLDRRRLQWEVKAGEEGKPKPQVDRPPTTTVGDDPRRVLDE